MLGNCWEGGWCARSPLVNVSLPHWGTPYQGALLPDSWKGFSRKCKVLLQKRGRNHKRTWGSFSECKGLKLQAARLGGWRVEASPGRGC